MRSQKDSFPIEQCSKKGSRCDGVLRKHINERHMTRSAASIVPFTYFHNQQCDDSSSEEKDYEDGKVEEGIGGEKPEDERFIKEEKKQDAETKVPDIALNEDLTARLKQAEQLLEAAKLLQKQMETLNKKEEL
ncbi:hypothetical protein QR680_010187 [Steinernema hermaphroditum]|uniref:Uncharacterized protein n=1 Tax=Steinernema hermaphroditum TaxID=289476 RepID=A0AA39IN33_9BILA|nr:hypothetical protein QR680_010187 [Steinernema hermaphroditum]